MGCACLLLAGKIEEISVKPSIFSVVLNHIHKDILQMQPPAVDALVYISDYCFDSDKLISAEQKILVLLDFKVFAPTRYYFASQLARIAEFNSKEICFTNFLLECSLQVAVRRKPFPCKISSSKHAFLLDYVDCADSLLFMWLIYDIFCTAGHLPEHVPGIHGRSCCNSRHNSG